MLDRRQQERFRVNDIDIYVRMIFANYVKILDLSLSGASFKADKRLNIGCNYMLKVEDKGKILNAKGTVIWSLVNEFKKGINGDIIPIYTAGMKFIDVSNKKLIEIANFIEDCKATIFIEDYKKKINEQIDAYKRSGLRHFVKVRINTPEGVLKNCQECFRVTELSLTSMCIESKQALEIEKRFVIELSFPDDKNINVLGYVASCCLRKYIVPELYDIGIEFIDVSEKERENLGEFILLHNAEYR
jgi:hypothetical protein